MRRCILLFLLFAIIVPGFAFAQDVIKLNLTYPSFGGYNLADDQALPEIIAFFYYFIVGIAGLAAFVMLVWGGVQWLTSGAAPSQASEARDKIRNAILGLLLVLASFLIIQVINPELTVGRGSRLEVKCSELDRPEACDPFAAILPDGTTTSRLPAGATVDGVYLCKKEVCACSSSPCVPQTNPADGSGDYLFLDLDAFPAQTTSGGSGLADLDKWGDEIEAIAIKGKFGVLLADDPNYGIGESNTHVTCFSSSGLAGGRLDDFMKKPNGDTWGFKGVQSVKILRDGICKNPGITLFSEDILWNDPTVFVFHNIEQGRFPSADIRYEVPLRHTTPFSGEPGPSEVRSLYISSGPDAARLFNSVGVSESGLQICFKKSVDDLSEYSWTANGGDMTDTNEIKFFSSIQDSECTNEGVVEPS